MADQNKLLDLIGRTSNGDRAAFRALYEETSPLVFGLLKQLLKREALASEVLQDTYLKVWQRADDYHSARGAVTTWISTIARYRALDILRASKDVGPADAGEVEIEDESPAEPPSLDRQKLGICLEELSSDQRQSIALAFYRGLTHEELAARQDVPVGTAKSWIRRGLAYLKDCMQR